MKLLFDQNLSPQLVGLLATEYPGSAHVRQVGLGTGTDPAIWAYASHHGFAVVSKDTDFQQRALLMGHPPKVVWVRLGNCRTIVVAVLLRSRRSNIQAFVADPSASFLALS